MDTSTPLGFWVTGGKSRPRVLVDARAAFDGFARCDSRVALDAEHYLSAFTYGDEFRVHLSTTASTRQFDGPCAAMHVWFDIDREGELDRARADTCALVLYLTGQYRVPEDELLVFFSGSKGLHVGLPVALWAPPPSTEFNRVAGRFAAMIARQAGGCGIAIDTGVYDKVRLFRAPNSRHPATGLYKRVLSAEELLAFGVDRIRALAAAPCAFEVPIPRGPIAALAAVWEAAAAEIAAEAAALSRRAVASDVSAQINALTLSFIREGAAKGGEGTEPDAGRHRRLYAAARNLAEAGCPAPLAHSLLTKPALDCGLPPGEVRRHIDNGLRDGQKGPRE